MTTFPQKRTRKRMPAFARALYDERVQGRHPARVRLIFSTDWSRRPEGALCVNPDEWAPGITDWRPLAGVPVDIVDRDGRDTVLLCAAEVAAMAAPVVVHWTEPDDVARRFAAVENDYQGDLSAIERAPGAPATDIRRRSVHAYEAHGRDQWRSMVDAEALACFPYVPGQRAGDDIASIAYAQRHAGQWPAWWSDELDRDYAQRRDRWFEAHLVELQRVANAA